MISVCIATYNGGKYIREQLDSIFPQLGPNDEVIISDDGSTDETLPIVTSYGDKRLCIIEGPHSGSPISNFEHALHACRGEYIFLADQDDVWKPNKIEVCMPLLKAHTCVISDAIVADEELKPIDNSFYKVNRTKSNKWYNLLVRNGYLGCCMAFKKELLSYAFPFPISTPMHDIWLGNVAAFHFDTVFIPDKLIFYRRHNGNCTPTAEKSMYSLLERIRFRWHVIQSLLNIYKV